MNKTTSKIKLLILIPALFSSVFAMASELKSLNLENSLSSLKNTIFLKVTMSTETTLDIKSIGEDIKANIKVDEHSTCSLTSQSTKLDVTLPINSKYDTLLTRPSKVLSERTDEYKFIDVQDEKGRATTRAVPVVYHIFKISFKETSDHEVLTLKCRTSSDAGKKLPSFQSVKKAFKEIGIELNIDYVPL